MESLDELLDFASDIGEEEDDMQTNKNRTKSLKHLSSSSTVAKTSGIIEEEELEWISNKDAFPKFESFADISPKKLNHSNKQSPVSVLENITNSNRINSLKVPVRARSKRRREQWQEYSWWWAIANNSKINKRGNNKPMKSELSSSSSSSLVVLGRKCQHCQTEKTPQWRAGPTGPKTLCNACGVRYKSGRLVPEYRPASSPTFSTDLHSNSHRKVLEMRKRKQITEPP